MEEIEFKALIEAMKFTPRPLALLGAGTSVDSGFPDWNTLLNKLEQLALSGEFKMSPKYKTFLNNLNDPAWQAEEYSRIIEKHDFNNFIANTFSFKNKIGSLLQIIVQLNFRHILTTNYDSCIEEAYKAANKPIKIIDWNEEEKMRSFFLDLSRDGVKPNLIYLHGRYYEPEKIILTETSYANRYVRSDDAQRKLFAILITQPVVFIGFSINDPDLNHLMREVNSRLGVGNPQHFAFMGYEVEEQRQLIKNRMNGKYGVQPVFYKISRNIDGSENHSDLLQILKQLYIEINKKEPVIEQLITANYEETGEVDRKVKFTDQEVLDPLDIQKGRWGGKNINNNRVLKAENVKVSKHYCTFDLVVEPVENILPHLEGEVDFYLHQTFGKEKYTRKVKEGKARFEDISAYGAFTVGAEADGGSTQLELDLSEDKQFPKWFRES